MELTAKELREIPEGWPESKRRKFIALAGSAMERYKYNGERAFRKAALEWAMTRCLHAK